MVNFCKIVRRDGRELYVNADTVAYVANLPAGEDEKGPKSLIQFIGEINVESSEAAVDTAKRLNDGIYPYDMQ